MEKVKAFLAKVPKPVQYIALGVVALIILEKIGVLPV